MATAIIPQWRIPKSEPEPPVISLTMPLSLTLAFVVVFLLDLACTLLCARWERFTQVIFCCTLCKRWFLAPAEVAWKTRASRFICWFIDSCDCVTAGHTVWGKFLRVGSRDVPLAKNPSTGTAQQRFFLVLKVVLHAVVVISEVLRLSTKSRCSRCCRHISSWESFAVCHDLEL